MKRQTRGALLIALGLALVAAGAAMWGMNEYRDRQAGQNAQALLTNLTTQITWREETAIYDTAQPEPLPAGEQPQMTLNGYELVGILKVESVGIELPVLNAWSYDLLQIAPCRYSGSVEGRDMILLAHNYRRHFSPLKGVSVGESVEFTDVEGVVHHYTVAATEILEKTELERLTTSGHALTLFTCTNGGYSRFVVRCDEAE